MTTPEELLVLRFGEVPLLHLGDLNVATTGGITKELAFYGARVKAGNQMSNNLLLVSVPLASDGNNSPKTVGQLHWISVYLRSYFSLKNLQDVLSLDWEKLAGSEEQTVSTNELPSGMWVKEIRGSGSKTKSKHYVFADRSLTTDYLVTVESRLKDSVVGNDLKDSYEFDMLLNYSGGHSIAVEKLSATN